MVDYSIWMPLAKRIRAILQGHMGTQTDVVYKLDDNHFYVRKNPQRINVDLPGLILFPVPERIIHGSTNATDDVGYGVQCTIAQGSNRDLEADHDRLHWWREAAIGQFMSRRVGGLPEFFVNVEPQPIIDPGAFLAGYDATAFVYRCWRRNDRPTQATPP